MPNDERSALVVAAELKASGIDILVIGTDDADNDLLTQLASRPDLALKVEASQIRATLATSSNSLLTPGVE